MLFIWNSNLIEHCVLLLAKSGNLTYEITEVFFLKQDVIFYIQMDFNWV